MTRALAFVLSALLLISTGLVTASRQDALFNSSEPSDRVSKSKIESLLREVDELVEEAREAIEQAESAGLDVKIYGELLEGAISKYQQGLEFYDRGEYDRAFSTLIYVKTRVLIIVNALRRISGDYSLLRLPRQEIEEKLKLLKEKYEALKSEVSGSDSRESLEKQLREASELISKAEDILSVSSQAAYSLLIKAEDILRQVEEEIGKVLRTVTSVSTAIVDASSTIEPTAQTILTDHETIVVATSSTSYPPQKAENITSGEVNIELVKKDGEYKVIVEHIDRLIQYENGTALIVREKIVTVGNKTIVSISKELVYGSNEPRSIGQVSVEREQNLIGAWVKVSKNTHPEIYRIDEVIEAEVVNFEKNRVRVRLKAPDNTTGRLFVIELSPDLVDLQNIIGFNLTVNGESAILASSLLDLASETYDQPAYLFILSAKGVQVLLYLPHFSEYIVEINAILQEIFKVFHENLQKIFTPQATTYATVIATIIMLASTALTIHQKRYLKKIE